MRSVVCLSAYTRCAADLEIHFYNIDVTLISVGSTTTTSTSRSFRQEVDQRRIIWFPCSHARSKIRTTRLWPGEIGVLPHRIGTCRVPFLTVYGSRSTPTLLKVPYLTVYGSPSSVLDCLWISELKVPFLTVYGSPSSVLDCLWPS